MQLQLIPMAVLHYIMQLGDSLVIHFTVDGHLGNFQVLHDSVAVDILTNT